MRQQTTIVSMPVDVVNHSYVLDLLSKWCDDDQGRYVCVSNVHMCIEAYHSRSFSQVLHQADLVVPDGRPIYWAQQLLGQRQAQQVRGMDLSWQLCELAAKQQKQVGFYGASAEVLAQLQIKLKEKYPTLQIACAISPPFRPLTEEEQQADIAALSAANVDFLFVGLGCPKQEQWMASHVNALRCTVLGVGAAFDFMAGNKPHAPKILQNLGLEWLYRLLSEPRRLWRRYLSTNPLFVFLFVQQLLGRKF